MKLGLCIDTSLLGSRFALVNIEDDFNILWFHLSLDRQTTLAEPLAILNKFLFDRELHYTDIKGVLVGVGPGSFTGIKIGLSFSYGFLEGAQNHKKSSIVCKGFSLLEELMLLHLTGDTPSFSSVILPSTKKSAYVSWLVDEEAKTCSYDFERRRPEMGSLLEAPLVIGEPKDKSVYSEKAVFLDLVKVNEECIPVFQSVFRRSWPSEFTQQKAEPLYLRRSTPEERMSQ